MKSRLEGWSSYFTNEKKIKVWRDEGILTQGPTTANRSTLAPLSFSVLCLGGTAVNVRSLVAGTLFYSLLCPQHLEPSVWYIVAAQCLLSINICWLLNEYVPIRVWSKKQNIKYYGERKRLCYNHWSWLSSLCKTSLHLMLEPEAHRADRKDVNWGWEGKNKLELASTSPQRQTDLCGLLFLWC